EAGMGNRAVPAQVDVPLVRLERQVVRPQALEEQPFVVDALPPADDLAVPLGRQNVDAQGNLRPLQVGLHVERLDLRRIAMNHHRRGELLRQDRLVPASEVPAPFDLRSRLAEDPDRLVVGKAVRILGESGSEIEWGRDFGGGDETILSEKFASPVMVHRYPSQVKAFYMQPDLQRPEVALCVDVLAPEGYGEIIGGGQRIHDKGLLLERLRAHDLPLEPYQWYIDLRRYGSVPHAGF